MSVFVNCPIYFLKVIAKSFYVLEWCIFKGISKLMYYAALYFGLWICRINRFFYTCQSINANISISCTPLFLNHLILQAKISMIRCLVNFIHKNKRVYRFQRSCCHSLISGAILSVILLTISGDKLKP